MKLRNRIVAAMFTVTMASAVAISPLSGVLCMNDVETVRAEDTIKGFNNENASLEIEKAGAYDSGIINPDGGSAEIVQYNSDNQKYYVVNGTSGTLDIVLCEKENVAAQSVSWI